MKVVHSEDHRLHAGALELLHGRMVPMFECPERLDMILEQLAARGFGERVAPTRFGLEPILRVHDAGYVAFLREAYDHWVAEEGLVETGPGGDGAGGPPIFALPFTFAMRGLRQSPGASIHARLGYYCFDLSVPFLAGTWSAIQAASDIALTGQRLVQAGERAAFALCRPPGHHAGRDLAGGYCYVNNAAVAAQAALDAGAGRVALLDVDYHHGNGTQAIFYQRAEVLFVSLHGDPEQEYPYFAGAAGETGAGAGEGYTLNLPMPWGTAWPGYAEALARAVSAVRDFGPDMLVVSLGVDTYKDDPISHFRLEQADYPRIGAAIAGLDAPTLFVMEGGYAVGAIGINVAKLLAGFEDAAR